MGEEKALVVTTEWRGVFFGYGHLTTDESRIIILRDCRMCVSWDSSVGGMPGLTSGKSLSKCRISPASANVKIYGVTAIFEVNKTSEKEWLKEPWN